MGFLSSMSIHVFIIRIFCHKSSSTFFTCKFKGLTFIKDLMNQSFMVISVPLSIENLATLRTNKFCLFLQKYSMFVFNMPSIIYENYPCKNSNYRKFKEKRFNYTMVLIISIITNPICELAVDFIHI